MTTTLSALALPFDEAIQYLADKTNATSTHWTDVWQQANAKAFTVAGAATQALVKDFRTEVAKALEQGTTLAEFRAQFDAIVKKHGWKHTGTPGWRAKIIYETNLAMAYSAGRFAQATAPETLAAFPYWQYVHSGALHPRLNHLAWNGLVLRADDPFWQTHYPPNGWRCGCRVRVLSARDLKRQGKKGPDQAPPTETHTWINPKTGEGKPATKGIDPGFDYNPGQTWKATPVSVPPNATLTVPPLKPKPKSTVPAKKAKPSASPPAAKLTPPPATAHGGNFSQALGYEGKFVDSFGFSSTLLGTGKPLPKGASAAVKAAFKGLEDAFQKWKKTGELPDKATVEALVKAVNPPPPGLRDPALGHVKDGSTKAMLAPKTTAAWQPVAEKTALADQRAAIRTAVADLDQSQRSAREFYIGSGYADWNAKLRAAGGTVPKIGRLGEVTRQLDIAIERSRLKTDVILHRGSKFDADFPSIEATLAKKGAVYRNHGYFSASVQRSTAEGFGSYSAKPPAPAVVFTIRAKAGMRAMAGTDYEVEYVFPRGQRWRILDVEVIAKDRVHVLLEPF